MTFARVILGTLLLLKVFAQAQVVSNAVLPSTTRGVVETECAGDPSVNFGQCEATIRRAKDGHANELRIRIRRFGTVVLKGRKRCGWREYNRVVWLSSVSNWLHEFGLLVVGTVPERFKWSRFHQRSLERCFLAIDRILVR